MLRLWQIGQLARRGEPVPQGYAAPFDQARLGFAASGWQRSDAGGEQIVHYRRDLPPLDD